MLSLSEKKKKNWHVCEFEKIYVQSSRQQKEYLPKVGKKVNKTTTTAII